ncbi:unnamed protein product [Closterium sp. Naga37s-1]|nr:unnamed protein product [Closterium sp. Naga37s-1]
MRGSTVQSPHTVGKDAHDAVLKAASLTSSALIAPSAPRLPVFADVDVSQYVQRHRGRRVEAENAARQSDSDRRSDLRSLCTGIRRYQLPGNGGGQLPGDGGLGRCAPTNAVPTICAVAEVAAPTPPPVDVLRASSAAHSAAAASSTWSDSRRLSVAGSAPPERAQSEGNTVVTISRENASCSGRLDSSGAAGLPRQRDSDERRARTTDTGTGIMPSRHLRVVNSAAAVIQCRPVNSADQQAAKTTCATRQPRSGTCRTASCAGGNAVGLVRATKAETGEEGEGKQDDGDDDGEEGEEDDDDVVLAMPVSIFRRGVVGAAPGEWDTREGRGEGLGANGTVLVARAAAKGWRGRTGGPGGRACDAGDEDEGNGDVVTCKPVAVRVTCFATPVIRRRVSRSAGGKLPARGAAGGRKDAARVAGGAALGRIARRSTAEGATLRAGREGSETGGSSVGGVPPMLVHKGMVLCDGARSRCETGREGEEKTERQEEGREDEAQDGKGIRRQAHEAAARSKRAEQAARAERAKEMVRGREGMAAEVQESRAAADVALGEDKKRVGAVSAPSPAVSAPSRAAVSVIEEGRIREQLQLIAEAVDRRAGQEEVRRRGEGWVREEVRRRGEGWVREEVRRREEEERVREERRIREEGRISEEGRSREEERIKDQLQLTEGVEEEGNKQQSEPAKPSAYLAKPSAYLGAMDALSWQDLYVDCDVADLWQEALGSSPHDRGEQHSQWEHWGRSIH